MSMFIKGTDGARTGRTGHECDIFISTSSIHHHRLLVSVAFTYNRTHMVNITGKLTLLATLRTYQAQ